MKNCAVEHCKGGEEYSIQASIGAIKRCGQNKKEMCNNNNKNSLNSVNIFT